MTVCFEFNRGPRDGEILEGCPENADIAAFDLDAATAYYWETEYGKVGTEYFVQSPCARSLRHGGPADEGIPPEHKYRVAQRTLIGPDVWVVAEYVGPIRHVDVPDSHHCPWYERLVSLGISEVIAVHKNFPQLPL